MTIEVVVSIPLMVDVEDRPGTKRDKAVFEALIEKIGSLEWTREDWDYDVEDSGV